jgi:hypothetical protein
LTLDAKGIDDPHYPEELIHNTFGVSAGLDLYQLLCRMPDYPNAKKLLPELSALVESMREYFNKMFYPNLK